MPIAIPFLSFGELVLDLAVKVRFEPAAPRCGDMAPAEGQRALMESELSRRLPARLVRDVLPL